MGDDNETKLDPTNVQRFRGQVRRIRGPSEDGIDLGVEMRDKGQDGVNRDKDSHDEFFGNSKQEGLKVTRGDRQKLRLTKAMNELLARTSSGVGGLSAVKTMDISDETWQQLMSHPEEWANEGFQPLSQYQGKIIQNRPDGTIKVLRSLIPGEVGIVERDGEVIYLVMEAGKGAPHQVGAQIGTKSPASPFVADVIYDGSHGEPDPSEVEVLTSRKAE